MKSKITVYTHNKTLDRLILAAAALRSGKPELAEEALEDIVKDDSGEVESELEVLEELNAKAWIEANSDEEDEDMSDEEDDEDMSEEAELEDMTDDEEDEDEDMTEETSSKILSRTRQRQEAPVKKKSHVAKVVANLSVLSRRR